MRLLFWSALAIALGAAAWPHPIPLPGNPSDKLQHLAAFAGLTALAAAAYPHIALVRIGIGMAVYGGLIEAVQLIPALNRHAEFLDWVADMVGVATALIGLAMLQRYKIRT